ncbi:TlpA family protein disulfide reductase [Sphingobacterium sp. MYb382]|uniref:TlpA family protein disulfide reductase n=1 Tax=Sphingobacterium sp. MYb382 TaxID=2745278 RepID=UPI003099A225
MLINKLSLFLILIVILTYSDVVYGQERVYVEINTKGIEKEKLVLHFDDGAVLDVISMNPGDSTVVVDRPIYTIHARLTVSYDNKYFQNYFITGDRGVLNLFYDADNKTTSFDTQRNTNVVPIYDTVSNEIYRELKNGQKLESMKLNTLFVNHGAEIRSNDSIKYELSLLIKEINKKSMDLLSSYGDDFLSFYYFKDQILSLTDLIESDPEYNNQLLAYYNNTFPDKFKSTGEGKKIAIQLQQKASALILTEGAMIPDILVRDVQGKTISLRNLDSDYALLDFWASWCRPCIEQLPDVKALHQQFSTDKLSVISISIDRDSTKFSKSVKEHQLNWTNSLDRARIVSSSLGISSVPTVLLLDRSGKISYYKNGGRLDLERIRKIILGN